MQAALERAGLRLVKDKVELPYKLFCDSIPAAHIQFLEQLQPYHRTEDALCVHGGINPQGGPVETQSVTFLLWGTDDFPDTYSGATPVVYGHCDNARLDETGWPWPRVSRNNTFGIDTISKSVLSAMQFPEGMVFQSCRHPTA